MTSLSDSGPGSLREAIGVAHRTIVFDVSGVIKLASRLVFKNNLTVAGQTASGGGIVIYGDGTSFSAANHTIVRYLRFRMGTNGESRKDTVGMANGHDVIWDHCSISWARDGNLDLNQDPEVPVMTALEAYQYATEHAGASLRRDAVDTYVLQELASLGKLGKTISDEASLGLSQGVGAIPTGTPPKDTDQDGMPDAWENAQGLDPTDANDRNEDRNGDGWTNLEEYINSLGA